MALSPEGRQGDVAVAVEAPSFTLLVIRCTEGIHGGIFGKGNGAFAFRKASQCTGVGVIQRPRIREWKRPLRND